MKNDGISIREFQDSDIDEIANLCYNTIHIVNADEHRPGQIEVWAPKVYSATFWKERFAKIHCVFVAVSNHHVVGFIEFESSGHIDSFYVHREWQQKGVGAQLIERLLEESKKLDVHRIYAEVNLSALHFFGKLGFSVTQEKELMYHGQPFKQFNVEKLF